MIKNDSFSLFLQNIYDYIGFCAKFEHYLGLLFLSFKTTMRKYNSSTLSQRQRIDITVRLIEYILWDKMYLNSNITIKDIAIKFGTNKAYISQAINESMHMNFSTFVNRYRIKEAKRIIGATIGAKLNVEDLAAMCGFNNRMAFYNSFKRHVGMTPYNYVRTLREERATESNKIAKE